jgi:glycosyltransferase involved in cell wall biosynthesis
MKLAFYCNEYPPTPHGGIGTFVHTMAHALANAGHEVTVVGFASAARLWNDGPIRIALLQQDYTPKLSWLRDRWKLRRWLKEEVSGGRIELLEIPEFDGPLPFPFKDCPVTVRLHASHTGIARAAGRKTRLSFHLCEKATLGAHRVWIGVSRHALALTEKLFGLTPAIGRIIYNPVTLPVEPSRAALPRLPDKFVLFAGGVTRRKGAYSLAEAAKHFLRADPSVDLVYAGPCPIDGGMTTDGRIRQILGPDLASRAHFLGRVDRAVVAACMRRAAVFAFPSTYETFGLVVAEAMLAGAPVVVSGIAPFTEFVAHEKTGLLIAPEAKELSAAVLRLLQSQPLSAQLGAAARRSIQQRFSAERCVSETEALYRELLGDGRAGPMNSTSTRSKAARAG